MVAYGIICDVVEIAPVQTNPVRIVPYRVVCNSIFIGWGKESYAIRPIQIYLIFIYGVSNRGI